MIIRSRLMGFFSILDTTWNMSKVTPVEEPELSVNENPHIHIHPVGEFVPTISQLEKTSNKDICGLDGIVPDE